MATNLRWRLRLQDWRQEFATCSTQPVPDAIPGGIFFDMRPVHGDSWLDFPNCTTASRPGPPVAPSTSHTWPRPPPSTNLLGFFRGFVLRRGSTPTPLDIKRGGIGAVVEPARVHALALGSPAVNTATRLQAAIAGGIMSEGGADLTDAFEFISTSGCGTRRPR